MCARARACVCACVCVRVCVCVCAEGLIDCSAATGLLFIYCCFYGGFAAFHTECCGWLNERPTVSKELLLMSMVFGVVLNVVVVLLLLRLWAPSGVSASGRLSAFPSPYLSMCQFVSLSVVVCLRLSVCLSLLVCFSVCVCVSVSLSLSPSLCRFQSVCLSLC